MPDVSVLNGAQAAEDNGGGAAQGYEVVHEGFEGAGCHWQDHTDSFLRKRPWYRLAPAVQFTAASRVLTTNGGQVLLAKRCS